MNGVIVQNSQMFHILVDGCHNAMIQGVKVLAPGNSPNTDGIHVQSSSGVSIRNSNIGTGDDCISIGPGNSNLWIEGIACGPGHGIRFETQHLFSEFSLILSFLLKIYVQNLDICVALEA